MTPEEVETEYWRVEFMAQPSEEFEDEDFEDDTKEILSRLNDGDDWQSVIEDVMGRDGKVG